MPEIPSDHESVSQKIKLRESPLSANRLLLSTALGTALAVLPASSIAQAAEPEGTKPAPTEEVEVSDEGKWKGLQVKTAVFGQKSLTDRVSWAFMVSNLTWPKAKIAPIFVFTGPKFQLTKEFWASPQVGLAAGFLEKEWVAGSIAIGLNRKKISLLMVQDLYGKANELATYTYLSADFIPIPQMSLGVHAEGINDQFTMGPHVGWQVNEWLNLGLQTFTSPQNGGTNLRLATQIFAF